MSHRSIFDNAKELPLLPLRDIVVFPHMVVPLFVGRERSISALEASQEEGKTIFLAAQRKANLNDPAEDDIFSVGTMANVIQHLRLPDGTVKVLVEGVRRGRIREFVGTDGFFLCSVEPVEEPSDGSVEQEALMRRALTTFERYVKLSRRVPAEMLLSVGAIEDPGRLADTLSAHITLKLSEKQALLETFDVNARLKRLTELVEAEVEVLLVERRLRAKGRGKTASRSEADPTGEAQHGQKEHGERDEFKNELEELEERIRVKAMPQEVKGRARRELRKLRMMAPMSAEATVVRNYLDWILALPWDHMSREKLDIDEAERILDEDHYGLEKAKERILEYLAVNALVDKIKGPILCFVGPPGVGKTSLARSIARATGRRYVRLSLGGVRDEAEIRGHRRTYIGALPGKIIQSLKRAGTSNPVLLLDEVDKMSSDFRGDPSAALLEVLDPEQNNTFGDHYLDMDYDLSSILFVTTANDLHGIPLPLQDRMEVIELTGYTEFDKLNIARDFLVPKQLQENGLGEVAVQFSDNALKLLINRYTREAGVRNLERAIASTCRKIARLVLKRGKKARFRVTESRIEKLLGPPKYRQSRTEECDEIGLGNGLAVTKSGGELLATEVTVMPGKGKLIITGKLGDVMQESAQAAMSYIRSRASRLRLERGFYQEVDIHIHVPEGAIPKDGPSAGITMATAIASALMQIPVRRDVAMTGEITLRGRVLPVGGVKEKILAAHRAGIRTVLIPRENEKNLDDMPKPVAQAMTIHLVEHMDEVLRHALAVSDPELLFEKLRNPASTDELGIRNEPLALPMVKAEDSHPEAPPPQGP